MVMDVLTPGGRAHRPIEGGTERLLSTVLPAPALSLGRRRRRPRRGALAVGLYG